MKCYSPNFIFRVNEDSTTCPHGHECMSTKVQQTHISLIFILNFSLISKQKHSPGLNAALFIWTEFPPDKKSKACTVRQLTPLLFEHWKTKWKCWSIKCTYIFVYSNTSFYMLMHNLTVNTFPLYALSNTSPEIVGFFFFNRQKQILANTNNRKCAPKRVQRSWSAIMQFPKHWNKDWCEWLED